MKKLNQLYIGALMVTASLASCEDFLTKDPQGVQTNDTYWQTELSLRTYAQDFYSSYFTGYNTDYVVFGGYFMGDSYVDDFITSYTSSTYSAGYTYFPASATTDYNAITSTWSNNYGIIYKANAMLEKIPGMNISEEAKNHWKGVARYFRAMAYSTMAKVYGGVPLYENVTDPADVALYKDRDSYVATAKFILDDFQYALDNVREDDTKRQVNKYTVGAYMSRELLYHATWLKYHNGSVLMSQMGETVTDADIKALLQGAANGAQAVMNSGLYEIGNTYNALFTTDDLWQNPEVIWYREYTVGVQCNAIMSYNAAEDQTQGGITQNAIESYLCSDGLPIGQSPLYQGTDDPSIQKSFIDRDPRLYQTIVDSLRIMNAKGTNYTEGTSPTGYPVKKFLNEEWHASGNEWATGRLSPADAPCIRYAEVLLNYAETMYELGQFSQTVLDATINKLRGRQLTKWGESEAKSMPTMTYSGGSMSVNGTVINDPARDTEVDPVLWEIRRERRVELMMEGRRGEDLRRWAKWEYLTSNNADGTPSKAFLGAYINTADYPEVTFYKETEEGETEIYVQLFDPEDPTNTTPSKGYINYEKLGASKTIRTFTEGDITSERYYLRTVPAAQITMYGDNGYTLTQNPGWDK